MGRHSGGSGNGGNRNPGGTTSLSGAGAKYSSNQSDSQILTVTDIISEGPIQGLVDGAASIYLNNDRLVPSHAAGSNNSRGPITISLTNGSNAVTFNNLPTGAAPKVKSPGSTNHTYVLVRGGHPDSGQTVTADYTSRQKQLLKTSSSYFVDSMITTPERRTKPEQLVPARLKKVSGGPDTPDGLPIEGFLWQRNSGTQARWRTGTYGQYTDFQIADGDYKLELDTPVQFASQSGNTGTLTANWTGTTGTYKWDSVVVVNLNATDIADTTKAKIVGGAANFRPGTLFQSPMASKGTSAVSVQFSGQNIETDTPREFSLSGNAPGLGLSASQIAEADTLKFRFNYASGFRAINKDGDDVTTFIRYRISIAIKEDGDSDFQALETLRNPETHSGRFINARTFESVINLERFRPFVDVKIKVERLDSDDDPGYKNPGVTDKDYRNITQSSLSGATVIFNEKLNYPLTAMADVTFSSKQYTGIPQRTYDLYGKMIRVPSNYVTREESANGIANYNRNVSTGAIESSYQDWDGLYRDELVYTNNPAWIYLDILTNNRYGLGSYIKDLDIDKYALYRISRYCDGLVPDGSGGLEPRFTMNTYITKSADSYKVLKDMATNFLGLLYYLDGKIFTSIDAPASPVYTFNKGNVINGTFAYETASSKTRANQIVVMWNDPSNDYKLQPLLVEDKTNIAETGNIVQEQAVAYGCTSEGQATRYGKWKLWTAANQKEVVSFSGGIEAGFIAPGDIINVQDADRHAVRLGGRISGNLTKGLTVTKTHAANTEILGSGTGYTSSERSLRGFWNGRAVLPSSFSNNTKEALFEHGGTGSGIFIGVEQNGSSYDFVFRAGDGDPAVTATNNNATVKKIPVSDIPEFDGSGHDISWYVDVPNGSARLWIDGRLVVDETKSNGSAFTNFSGGNSGGWGRGYDAVAGDASPWPGQTAWSGTMLSSLDFYSNQVPTFPQKSYIPLDSTVALNSGSTYTISVVVNEPAAFAREAVTIGSTNYAAGDLITEAYVGSSLVTIDTKEKAANARASANGSPITLDWKDHIRTETQPVDSSLIGSSVTAITTSTAFTTAPTKESVWVLTETINDLTVKGSLKEYKVLAISQTAMNEYDISGIEHYDQKWNSVEEDFTTYVQGDLEANLTSEDVVPPVDNLTGNVITSENTSRSSFTVRWDPPAAAQAFVRSSSGGRHNQQVDTYYPHLLGYQVTHNIVGYENPMRISRDVNELVFEDLVSGDYVVSVKTINVLDNTSEPETVQATVVERFADSIPRVPLGLPIGGTASVALKAFVNDTSDTANYGKVQFKNNVYTFKPAQPSGFVKTNTSSTSNTYQLDVSGIPETTAVNTSTESGSFIQRHFYVSMNSSQAAPLTLLKYNATASHNVPYWFDAGDGSEGAGLANLTGTASASNSSVVTGSGTAFTTELRVGSLFYISATVAAKVTSIVSDTSLYLDRVVNFSSTQCKTSNHTFDFANETIIAKVFADDNSGAGKVITLVPFLTLDAGLQAQSGVTFTLYKKVANGGAVGTVNTTSGTFALPADGAATGWSLSVPSMDANNDIIYGQTRIFTSDGESPQEAAWSSAFVVARRQDGAAGTPAEDAKTVIVYKKFTSGQSAPTAITFTSGNDATDQTHSNPTNELDGWSTDFPAIGNQGDRVYAGQRTFTISGSGVQQSAWTFTGLVAEIKFGPRNANLRLHYTAASSSAPTAPTSANTNTFNFSTNTFNNVASGWSHEAPVYEAASSGKFWYVDVSVSEATFGDSSPTITFTASRQAIGFTGLVAFTKNDAGGTTGNLTTIDGGVINSTSTITAGTGTNKAGLTGTAADGSITGQAETDIRIFAGAPFADRDQAAFKVTQSGQMDASHGRVGGFLIGADVLETTGFLAEGETVYDEPRLIVSHRDSNRDRIDSKTIILSSDPSDDYLMYSGVVPGSDGSGVTTTNNPPFSVDTSSKLHSSSFDLTDSTGASILSSTGLLGTPALTQITEEFGGGATSAFAEPAAGTSFHLQIGTTQTPVLTFAVPSGTAYVAGATNSVNDIINTIYGGLTVTVKYRVAGSGSSFTNWGSPVTFTAVKTTSSTPPSLNSSQYWISGETYSARSGTTTYSRAQIELGYGAVDINGNFVGSVTGPSLSANTYEVIINTTHGSGTSVTARTATPVNGVAGSDLRDYGYGVTASSQTPAGSSPAIRQRSYTISGGNDKWNKSGTSPIIIKDSVNFNSFVLKGGDTMGGNLDVPSITFGDSSPTINDSGHYLQITTSHGYTRIGSGNSTYSHFYTDRGKYYFNRRITVDEGIVQSYDQNLILRRAGSSSYQMTLSTSGATFTHNVTAYSDGRLKEDVKPIQNALSTVAKLQGVTYTRIDNEEKNLGFIAQQIEEACPELAELVVGEMDDERKTKHVNYANMVALLVEAVKELKAEVDELKEAK